MKRFLRVLMACFLASNGWAQEATSSLQFPNTDVLDVLVFYARSVKKPIYVSPQVSGGVTIEWSGLAKDRAEFLRQTLLEKYGIAIRETKDGELLAEYSKDPKYAGRPDQTKAAVQPKGVPVPAPGLQSPPNARVRPR